MTFSQDLKAIGTARLDRIKTQAGHVKAWHKEVEPAKQYALAAIPKLEELFNGVRKFIAQVESAGVADGQVQRWLDEIKLLARKPAELKDQLERLKSVGWSDINCPAMPHEIEPQRRNALRGEFVRNLSKYGDIERRTRNSVEMIVDRVKKLAEAGGGVESTVTPLARDEAPDDVWVTSNFNE